MDNDEKIFELYRLSESKEVAEDQIEKLGDMLRQINRHKENPQNNLPNMILAEGYGFSLKMNLDEEIVRVLLENSEQRLEEINEAIDDLLNGESKLLKAKMAMLFESNDEEK